MALRPKLSIFHFSLFLSLYIYMYVWMCMYIYTHTYMYTILLFLGTIYVYTHIYTHTYIVPRNSKMICCQQHGKRGNGPHGLEGIRFVQIWPLSFLCPTPTTMPGTQQISKFFLNETFYKPHFDSKSRIGQEELCLVLGFVFVSSVSTK